MTRGVSAADALRRLREGNRRFVAGERSTPPCGPARREQLARGQTPWAVILGCADSRVPPEVVFDQGPGELFVVRVAGNVATPAQLGSIEFAATQLGTRLVVVLGHSRCGAVTAAVDAARGSGSELSPGLRAIVDEIRPAAEAVVSARPTADVDTVVAEAVRAHVAAVVDVLPARSSILDGLVRDDGLQVIGGEYALDTGIVRLDEPPSGDHR